MLYSRLVWFFKFGGIYCRNGSYILAPFYFWIAHLSGRYHDTIERYSEETDSWEIVGEMPTSRSWLSCVSMQLRKDTRGGSCPGTAAETEFPDVDWKLQICGHMQRQKFCQRFACCGQSKTMTRWFTDVAAIDLRRSKKHPLPVYTWVVAKTYPSGRVHAHMPFQVDSFHYPKVGV